jgi:hypothetical protein
MSSPEGTSWLGRFAAGGLSKPVPPMQQPPPTQQQQQQQQQQAGAAPPLKQQHQLGGGGGHAHALGGGHPQAHAAHHEPPTPETQKKVDAAKAYIENLYKNQAKSLQQRMDRRMVGGGLYKSHPGGPIAC